MTRTVKTLKIPPTVDEALSSLDGIGQLITARKWERAAIVYALTQAGQGQRSDLAAYAAKLTYTGLAARGISGLTDRDRVAWYHDQWANACKSGDAEPVKLGDTVKVPALPWPPTGNPGREPLAKNVLREAGRLTPDERAAVTAALIQEPEVFENPEVHAAVIDQVASDPVSTVEVVQAAQEKRPTPVKPVHDRTAMDAVVSLSEIGAAEAGLEKAVKWYHRVMPDVVADINAGLIQPETMLETIKTLAACQKSLAVDFELLKIATERTGGTLDDELAALLEGGVS